MDDNPQVVDLMLALERSLAEAKARLGLQKELKASKLTPEGNVSLPIDQES